MFNIFWWQNSEQDLEYLHLELIIILPIQFSCSVMSDSLWPPWTAAHQASLSITNSQSLLRLMSFKSVMPSNHLILWHPLLLLPSVIPSIRLFSNKSALCFGHFGGQSIGVSALASVLPINIQDWFPLALTDLIFLQSNDSQENSLAPQFKSFNSLLLSLLYGPTLTSEHDYWKNIAWTIWTFSGKVMSLLFNLL